MADRGASGIGQKLLSATSRESVQFSSDATAWPKLFVLSRSAGRTGLGSRPKTRLGQVDQVGQVAKFQVDQVGRLIKLAVTVLLARMLATIGMRLNFAEVI